MPTRRARLRAIVKRIPGADAAYDRLHWRWHRLRDWSATYLRTGTRTAGTPYGVRLTVGNYPANLAMLAGAFEPEEVAAVREMLPAVGAFVDVGANVGLYALLAATAGRRVVAVEPQPRNLALLRQNLAQNGCADAVDVVPLALADAPGTLALYGATGPSASLVGGWAGYSRRAAQTVAVSTLDAVLGDRFAGQRLLVKIDVEGAEFGVLLGGLRTLARSPRPAWLVECFLDKYHPEGNRHFADTFRLFFDHGYEARALTPERPRVTAADVARWVRAGRSDAGAENFLFTAPTTP